MIASFRTMLGVLAQSFVTPCARPALLFGSCAALLSVCAAFAQSDLVANRSIEATIRLMANSCLWEEMLTKYSIPYAGCAGGAGVVAKLHEMSLQGDLTEQLLDHSFKCTGSKTTTTCEYRNTIVRHPMVPTNPDYEDTIEVRAVYPTSAGPIELNQIHVEAKRLIKRQPALVEPREK
jgi:hypothetical protein